MTGWRIVAATTLGVCLLLLGAWLAHRVNKFGINDMFSREHQFSDERPLTEQVALEITRRALEADGYDTSVLSPVEYRHEFPEGHAERFFARNTLNSNSGRVLWGPAPAPWGSLIKRNAFRTYAVRIEKSGSEIRCRVYKGK